MDPKAAALISTFLLRLQWALLLILLMLEEGEHGEAEGRWAAAREQGEVYVELLNELLSVVVPVSHFRVVISFPLSCGCGGKSIILAFVSYV